MSWLRTARRTIAAGTGVLAAVSVALLVVVGIGPRTGAYRVLTVLTGSMHPAIPVGSMVVVRPQPVYAVEPGQVLTFHAPVAGAPVVTHRVVEVMWDGGARAIRTKGDANAAPDSWTARLESPTVWRVARVVPGAGWAIVWLRRDWIRRVTVLLSPALVALLWLRWIWGTSSVALGPLWEGPARGWRPGPVAAGAGHASEQRGARLAA